MVLRNKTQISRLPWMFADQAAVTTGAASNAPRKLRKGVGTQSHKSASSCSSLDVSPELAWLYRLAKNHCLTPRTQKRSKKEFEARKQSQFSSRAVLGPSSVL